eukprot:TRINITY_DN4172_c0_g1_i4.p1 TRINITY_DN4172_c0_g1~~TRINITY_DN4172_c0_g1_i4.p1  ORF type:complete len:1154 (-),score=168.11 TRINITY_DN4172_c0_g1_i4:204-3665(-)
MRMHLSPRRRGGGDSRVDVRGVRRIIGPIAFILACSPHGRILAVSSASLEGDSRPRLMRRDIEHGLAVAFAEITAEGSAVPSVGWSSPREGRGQLVPGLGQVTGESFFGLPRTSFAELSMEGTGRAGPAAAALAVVAGKSAQVKEDIERSTGTPNSGVELAPVGYDTQINEPRVPSLNPILYSIKSVTGGGKRYCSDNGELPVTCDGISLGIDEGFQLFHWSQVPNVHVIKGGRRLSWCRDHGNFVACNSETITKTEEFVIKRHGHFQVIRGFEKNEWCQVGTDRLMACNSRGFSNKTDFIIMRVPTATSAVDVDKSSIVAESYAKFMNIGKVAKDGKVEACEGLADTWGTGDGATPDESCSMWWKDPHMGTPKGKHFACSTGWARRECASTCCLRIGPAKKEALSLNSCGSFRCPKNWALLPSAAKTNCPEPICTSASLSLCCYKQCEDTAGGAVDLDDLGCDSYQFSPQVCGAYDDDDFTANEMCCACKPPAAEVAMRGKMPPVNKTSLPLLCPWRKTTNHEETVECGNGKQCLIGSKKGKDSCCAQFGGTKRCPPSMRMCSKTSPDVDFFCSANCSGLAGRRVCPRIASVYKNDLCPWLKHMPNDNVTGCLDGSTCSWRRNSSTTCCATRGGTARCPNNAKTMCTGRTADGDHICDRTCHDFGGTRFCTDNDLAQSKRARCLDDAKFQSGFCKAFHVRIQNLTNQELMKICLPSSPEAKYCRASCKRCESVATNENNNLLYLGCFVDDPLRDLKIEVGKHFTTASCKRACEQFPFLALQDGGVCRCGKAFSTGKVYRRVDDAECGDICVGERDLAPRRLCGGSFRNAIYKHTVPPGAPRQGPRGKPGNKGRVGKHGRRGKPGMMGMAGEKGLDYDEVLEGSEGDVKEDEVANLSQIFFATVLINFLCTLLVCLIGRKELVVGKDVLGCCCMGKIERRDDDEHDGGKLGSVHEASAPRSPGTVGIAPMSPAMGQIPGMGMGVAMTPATYQASPMTGGMTPSAHGASPMQGMSTFGMSPGVSPSPAMHGRSPSPAMHGMSPSPAMHGMSPSPAMHGMSPSPAMHGRSPSPAMHGMSPSPAMHGMSPSPAMHGRSPSPAMHGMSPSPAMGMAVGMSPAPHGALPMPGLSPAVGYSPAMGPGHSPVMPRSPGPH